MGDAIPPTVPVPRITYEECEPPSDLRAVVQAGWTVTGGQGDEVRVLPDACVDLIALDDGVERVLINGPMPTAEVVPLSRNRVSGVRLLPGTLVRLGGVASLAELRGSERVVEGPAARGEPRDQLLAWVRQLVADGMLQRDPAVDAVLSRMSAGVQATTVRRVGPRQMQRLFATYVGLSPRETYTILRQSLVAKTLRSHDGTSLAILAADHGFVDQAHLTKAFQRLALITPGAYRHEIRDDAFVQDDG